MLQLGLLFLLVNLECAGDPPPCFVISMAGSTRVSVGEFSVASPGAEWITRRREDSVEFGKMQGAAVSHVADLSVVLLPAEVSRAEFIASVRRRNMTEHSRYKLLWSEVKEDDRGGAWRAICRLDCEDYGAVNAGAHGPLIIRAAYIVALYPSERRLITISYSSRGPQIDKAEFEKQAEEFLGSFRRDTSASPNQAL
jgi:hypothetical protein